MTTGTDSLSGRLTRLVIRLAGMNGIRIDRGRILLLWLPAAAGSLWLCDTLVAAEHILPYAIGAWCLYYLGNALLLGTALRSWMITRYGEARAYQRYEAMCGVMFINIGLAHGATCQLGDPTLVLPAWITWPLVGTLVG